MTSFSSSPAASSPRRGVGCYCVISRCASIAISSIPASRRTSRAPSRFLGRPTVSRPVFPQSDARTAADDGDELRFCSTCAFSDACLSQGMDKSELLKLHVLVEHAGPLRAGDHVFRKGDPFEAIAAVRAGTVKT